MKSYLIKILQALVVIFFIIFLPSVYNLRILNYPQLWIMAIIGIIATVFQPSYNPLKKATGKEDRGTALQIIWSVYMTQLAIIVEATYLRFPESVNWNCITTFALIIMFVGILLRSWAVTMLGNQFTWHINSAKNGKLVKTGPFQFLRHPGYAGALLTYTFSAIFLHAWFSLIFSFIVLSIAFLRRIYFEEYTLKQVFGKEYLDYCKKTKRIFPLIW